MNNNSKRHRIILRLIVTVVIMCQFSAYTVSWPSPLLAEVPVKDSLQVRSIFSPIDTLRIEAAVVLAMVLRSGNMPFHDINAELDKWYSSFEGRERMMDVVPSASYREGDLTSIELKVFRGPHKGRRVKVISSCKSPADMQADDANLELLFIDDKPSPQEKWDTKLVPMEIGKARQRSAAEIIFTGRIKDRAQRERLIEEVISAYEQDTYDYTVDYADGIDRSKDEMIVIRELNGSVLGFISYGKTEEDQYMSYFQYVFRPARGRKIGRNLIWEMVKEVSKDVPREEGRSFLTTTPLTYDGENLWTTLFGESVIKKERRPGKGEFIRRARVDMGIEHNMYVEPMLARQPILNDSFVATIDGPSGTGKSSSASEAAKRLGAVHFSYGKIYRLITWFALKKGIKLSKKIDPETVDRLSAMAKEFDLALFKTREDNGLARYLYEEDDITDIFYSENISGKVAFVSAIPEIRRIAARKVRDMIKSLREAGISFILEGRVTGTEIAPDADIKIYLNADINERAERRARQMIKKDGFEETCRQKFGLSERECKLLMEDGEEELFKKLVKKVADSITERDDLDKKRDHMPATEPKNAVIVDSTGETLEDTVSKIVKLIEVARIRGLVERNIALDEAAVKRLHVFYEKYVSLVKELFDSGREWIRDEQYIYACLAPEHIADLFYLSEVYRFDIFELLGKNKRTRWIKETEQGKTEYEFTLDRNNTVTMRIPSSDGTAPPEEIAKSKRNSSGVKDRNIYKGRNMGHFIVKTKYLVLWAKERTKKEDVGIAANFGQNKLIKLFESWGAKTYMDFDGDMRAVFDIFGGLDASILTAEQAEKVRDLDTRIWHRWSQRSMDRYLSMVRGIELSLLEKAQNAYSEEHKSDTIEELSSTTPGTIANFVLLKVNEETKEFSEKIENGTISSTESGFSPFIATEEFYTLQKEAKTEVDNAVKAGAASIYADPETGEKRYYTQGKPMIPLKAHVYIREGKSWDLPSGIELPQNLRDIINTKEGAMILTCGPFYVKKEGSPDNSNIRPLTDEEVYRRFNLRRVYTQDNQPLDMPALGISGRALLLPVFYMIATVPDGKGIKIVRERSDLKSKTLNKHHIFGLEFKGAGIAAYTAHNRNNMFDPTIYQEHVGKPGIFLDWWYQLDSKSPVGLTTGSGMSLQREAALLSQGGQLTRWTLAADIDLENLYSVALRAPVGDYRRLNNLLRVPFGYAKETVFNKILDDLELTREKYLLILSGNYGKNLRGLVKTRIMESRHGSLIDSDIFGQVADLGDFWKIDKNDKKNLKRAIENWISNLEMILNLSGKEYKDVKNSALAAFADAFFGGSGLPEGVEIDIENTEPLKKAIVKHAFDILRSLPEKKEVIDESLLEEMDEIFGQIDDNNRYFQLLFSGVKKYFISMIESGKTGEGSPVVDIIVDLSLIDRSDAENNASTWAQLILLSEKLKNVNFIFKERDLNLMMPKILSAEIENAPREKEMLSLLREKIDDAADSYGLKEVDVEKLFSNRINVPREGHSFEILISSKEWFSWLKSRDKTLDLNQYPVIMEGPTRNKKGYSLRNFEAALAIGLVKSALAIAKWKGNGIEEAEDEKIRNLIEDTNLIVRLQNLYDIIFDGKIKITENTLKNMVYSDATVRMNLAVILALPPITNMPLHALRILHENIQTFLSNA
ncbi:MAG: (d)CMP kinase [Candidatus Omnitrophota bacterium]